MSDVNWDRLKMSESDQTTAMINRLNELLRRHPLGMKELFAARFDSTNDHASDGRIFTAMRIINELMMAAKMPKLAKVVDEDTDELFNFCQATPPRDGFQ